MNEAFDVAVKKHFDVNPEEYLMYRQGKLAQATEMIEKRREKGRARSNFVNTQNKLKRKREQKK